MEGLVSDVTQSSHHCKYNCHIRAEFVFACDWAVLWTVDADGAWRRGSWVDRGYRRIRDMNRNVYYVVDCEMTGWCRRRRMNGSNGFE